MHVADAFRQSPGRSVVSGPPVAVFSQWVEDLLVRACLLDGEVAPATANPVVLQQCWAEALSAQMSFLAEAECALAARQARTAQRLIRHWWPASETPRLERAFWAAGNAVARRLAAPANFTPEDWLLGLAQRLEDGRALPVPLPERLLLDGFIELTRLENRTMAALQGRGVVVEECRLPDPPGQKLHLASFPSLEAELAAAAHWAKGRLASGTGQIVVVINELENHAHLAGSIFENVLCTGQRLALQGLDGCVFHLPHGEPLAAHPVISDALLLISLAVTGLGREREFPALSRWLLSPWWRGADSERGARARLELRLRKHGRYWRSALEASRLQPDGGGGHAMEVLRACCQQVAETQRGGAGDVAQRFHDVLNAWGWPGPLAGGGDVARHVSQFGRLLEDLRCLAPTTDHAALRSLQQMCADARVELRGSPLSPVQVLSPEDAAGRRYDAAWIANLHDGNWPSHPLMNPLLPAEAATHIPRSTAAGELAYCERLTRELEALAPDVRFSWSQQTGDVPNGVSPLLAGLEPAGDEYATAGAASLHHLVAPRAAELTGYRDHPWLVAVADNHGVPLRGPQGGAPAEAIPGGASMVQDQSACPLMAYARHRLKARFEDMPTPFADAAYRGSLMHTALQQLFAQQLGHAGLPSPDRIPEAVRAALAEHRANLRLLPVSLEAERLRLENLLQQWLEFERERPGFTVDRLELAVTGELLGHAISMRVDRIDRLDDGSLLIIDYKSSKGSTSGWSRDRLHQAQLPLYAVLLARQEGERVSGISLATVRVGECGFSGVSADADRAFDGIRSFDNGRAAFARRFGNWDGLFAHWQRGIAALAGEIAAGAAANALYDKDSLEWAGLDILLRRPEGEAWVVEHGGEIPESDDLDEAADADEEGAWGDD